MDGTVGPAGRSNDVLQRIQLRIPESPELSVPALLLLLAPFGTLENQTLTLTPTHPDLLPLIDLSMGEVATATFITDSKTVTLALTDTTGQVRLSPHSYTPITLDDVRSRIAGQAMATLDHVGFNLPWFRGLHPELRKLRTELKDTCAYHRSFSGESWDFVLPATEGELTLPSLDYRVVRRPKFELVTIGKTSTPIIQLDFSLHTPYERLVDLFPEGIPDPELRNIWVYLKNDTGVDVCLVVGEHSPGDCSLLFRTCRL